MTFSELVNLGVSSMAVIAAAILGVWSTRQDNARNRLDKHLENTDRRVSEHDNRLTILEQNFKHLPTNESNAAAFRLIYDKLDTMKDQLSRIQGVENLGNAIVGGLDRLTQSKPADRRKSPRN